MACRKTTRVWKSLEQETKDRFRDYIQRNELVESEVLAEELLLSKQTVAAIRANLSR